MLNFFTFFYKCILFFLNVIFIFIYTYTKKGKCSMKMFFFFPDSQQTLLQHCTPKAKYNTNVAPCLQAQSIVFVHRSLR